MKGDSVEDLGERRGAGGDSLPPLAPRGPRAARPSLSLAGRSALCLIHDRVLNAHDLFDFLPSQLQRRESGTLNLLAPV